MKTLIAILLLLLALTIAGWAVSMIHVIKVLRPDKKPVAEEVIEPAFDPKWLLHAGTGVNWLKLNRSQKIAVCKEASARFHASGEEVARYYILALDASYARPAFLHLSIASQIILAEVVRQATLRPSESPFPGMGPGGLGDPLDNFLNPPYIIPKNREFHEQNGIDRAAGLFVECLSA